MKCGGRESPRRPSDVRPRGGARRPAIARAGWLGWGALAVAAYLATVLWAQPWPVPVRLLYDAYTPPQPYHWLHPPAAVAHGNVRPTPGEGVVQLTPQGSAPASIGTTDEQAFLVAPRGAFAVRRGEPSLAVRLEPLDPTTIAPSPGTGLVYDSNAYRITAVYTVSRQPAPLIAPVNIVLRFATGSSMILRASGSGWVPLSPTALPITFQIYGPTNDLGVFAAAGAPPQAFSFSVWAYRIVTALLWLVAAAIAGVLLRDYLRRGKRAAARRPR